MDELSRLLHEMEGSDTNEEYTIMSVGRNEMVKELWSHKEFYNQQGEMVCFE